VYKKDLWLDNLPQGTCIDVYNCFKGSSNTSLLDYYAMSKQVSIYHLEVTDLEAEATKCIELKYRLDLVKSRIECKQVGDIDYFKFPTKFLQSTLDENTDE